MWIHYLTNTNEPIGCDAIGAPLRFESDPIMNTAYDRDEDDSDEQKVQVIAKRVQCPRDGFQDSDIRRENSKKLPIRKWTYGNSSGICEGKDAQNCLPRFPLYKTFYNLFTAKSSKLGFCKVHKSASVVVISIACLLNDPLKFLNRGKDLIADAFDRQVQFNVQTAEENGVTTNEEWKLGFVIRDPLDRFLSAFTHLCLVGREKGCLHLCYDCGSNMTCFLDRLYLQLKNIATNENATTHLIDNHLQPQSWFCELDTHFTNFTFLLYDSDSRKFYDNSLKPFLKSQNVSADALDFIGRSLTSARAQHSTTNFELKPFLKERILRSSYLLEMFLRIYYHDYLMFNFTLPQISQMNSTSLSKSNVQNNSSVSSL
ncbi:hypothetical protein M3Y95_00838300 [Aphelenchoides besseyi]|nr:hypothetical protein M3Y95_00838300 [Aphelenchoides besseyi]